MDDYIPLISQYVHTATKLTTFWTTKVLSVSAPLKSYIASASHSNPDLTNLVLLLAVIYLSLGILGMVTRYVYSTVLGLIKISLLIIAMGISLWVWTSGATEVLKVAQDVLGRLVKESQIGAREGFERSQDDLWEPKIV